MKFEQHDTAQAGHLLRDSNGSAGILPTWYQEDRRSMEFGKGLQRCYALCNLSIPEPNPAIYRLHAIPTRESYHEAVEASVEFAHLCNRVPLLDRVRFTWSSR